MEIGHNRILEVIHILWMAFLFGNITKRGRKGNNILYDLNLLLMINLRYQRTFQLQHRIRTQHVKLMSSRSSYGELVQRPC